MKDIQKRNGLSKPDQDFLRIIDEYGWHVTTVSPAGGSGEQQMWFAYSTGLFFRFAQPEIIVCGLDEKTAIGAINLAGKSMKEGKVFEIGVEYFDLFENCGSQFRPVNASNYAAYLGRASWFYENHEFPMWQLFWPDGKRRYPWDPDCDNDTKRLQPNLFKASN